MADQVKQGIREAGGVPIEFTTISVTDGIAMGTEGMKASLISRDIIADSIELATFGHRLDGLVTLGGCDKTLPGCLMAIARLNLPSVFVYGGSILPGTYKGKKVTIQAVFEAVGAYSKGDMTFDEVREHRERREPRRGSLRRPLHGEHDVLVHRGDGHDAAGRLDACRPSTAARCRRRIEAGRRVVRTARREHPPARHHDPRGVPERDLGGAGDGRLDERRAAPSWRSPTRPGRVDHGRLRRLERKRPCIGDMLPGGRYVDARPGAGGRPADRAAARCIEAGLFDGEPEDVTGGTFGENLDKFHESAGPGRGPRGLEPALRRGRPGDHVRQPRARGRGGQGGRRQEPRFTGPCTVSDSEEAAMQAVMRGEIQAGDVIVIRYEGPKGGPGMREMLGVTSALVGQGLGEDVVLITDGRFAAASRVLHRPRRPGGDGRRPDRGLSRTATPSPWTSRTGAHVKPVGRGDQGQRWQPGRRPRRSTLRRARQVREEPSPRPASGPSQASVSATGRRVRLVGRGLVPRQRPSTLTDWMHSCNPGIRASESAWILRFMRSLGICVRSRSRYGTDNASSPLLILLMRPSRCLRHFPRVIVSRFTPSASCQITFTYSWNLQTPVTSSHSMDSSRILLSGKPGNSVSTAPFGSTASGTTSYGRTKISRWLPTTYARIPVRAGLVDVVGDYPFSGSLTCEVDR